MNKLRQFFIYFSELQAALDGYKDLHWLDNLPENTRSINVASTALDEQIRNDGNKIPNEVKSKTVDTINLFYEYIKDFHDKVSLQDAVKNKFIQFQQQLDSIGLNTLESSDKIKKDVARIALEVLLAYIEYNLQGIAQNLRNMTSLDIDTVRKKLAQLFTNATQMQLSYNINDVKDYMEGIRARSQELTGIPTIDMESTPPHIIDQDTPDQILRRLPV